MGAAELFNVRTRLSEEVGLVYNHIILFFYPSVLFVDEGGSPGRTGLARVTGKIQKNVPHLRCPRLKNGEKKKEEK